MNKKSGKALGYRFNRNLLTAAIAMTMPLALTAERVNAVMLEEVTVTARKVQESLQDVPVAVSVVDSEALENYNMDELGSMADRIPSLKISAGGPGAGGSLTMRGIGNPFSGGAFDPAVAMNMDGVPLASMRLVNNAFIDLEQVEVLKGPQSVFFGKSATAGVIDLTTRNPTDEFEAKISTSYEFEEERTSLQGIISGPINDELAARLLLSTQDADVVTKNPAPGVANPERGEERTDARLTLVWDPRDDLSVNFKTSYDKYENDGSDLFGSVRCGEGRNGQGSKTVYPQLIGLFTGTPNLVDPGYKCSDFQSDRFYRPDQLAVEAANTIEGSGGVPYTDMTTFMHRLKVDYDVSEQATLTSITGYFDMDFSGLDPSAYAEPGAAASDESMDLKNISQELRLAGTTDSGLSYQVGIYYEERDFYKSAEMSLFGAAATIEALGLPGFVNGADPITGYTSDWKYESDQDITSKSIYSSLKYDFSDEWTISGGLRYSEDERRATYSVPYMHALLSSPAVGIGLPSGYESDEIAFEDDNVSGELSLTRFFSNDTSMYIAYKSGYKAGGVDNSALPLITDVGAGGDALKFDSETSSGFEVGFKSELFENSLRLNGVVYSYVYEDLQTQQFDSVGLRYVTFNAGEITIRGMEWDALWATPIEGLRVTGAIGYLDSEFTEEFVSERGVDIEGRTPKQAPEWSGSLGATYEVDLNSKLMLRLGANVAFSSSYYLDDQTFDDHKQESYQSYDLSAAITTLDGKWDFSLFATNVTDEIYSINSYARPLGAQNADPSIPLDTRESLNRGREITARIVYNF